MNKKDDKMLINDDSYIGTIIEVGLNVAKFKINSYIKNAYSMVSGNLISLGRVNDYCIIYNVFCPILCKINYIHTSENDKKNIENKINSVNKYEMDTIGSLKYLGTIDKNLSFKNGIQVYPSVTDRVFMPTEEVLQKILWENNIEDKAYLEFAKDFHFKNIIPIAAEVIFNKHCAILGSSGCGKSNTVAKIIEEFVKNTDSNKKIILIDSTGEYGKIKDQGNMENIENDFYIDRQHVSLEDLCFYLNPSSQVQYPVLAEAVDKWQKDSDSSLTESVISVVNNKKDQSTYCQTLIMRLSRLEGIGVEAKSMSDKNKQKYTDYKIRTNENTEDNVMDWLLSNKKNGNLMNGIDDIINKIDQFLGCTEYAINAEIYKNNKDKNIKEEDTTNYLKNNDNNNRILMITLKKEYLIPLKISAKIKNYDNEDSNNESDFIQNKSFYEIIDDFKKNDKTTILEVHLIKKNSENQENSEKFQIKLVKSDNNNGNDVLDDKVKNIDNEICKKIDDFLKGNKKILRIDLSGFTSKNQSKELLINFLSNYIFTKRKKDKNNGKDGKDIADSVILCIDEAHNFLNKTMKYTDTEKKLDAVDIIAKEGRKYGLNLMLATQRTQDIPEDILSQIGFIISHKLSNEDDLRLIKNAISYMDETIMQAIPMLQTGHAFLLCSELKFPRQVIISQPSSQPQSESKKWSKNKNS